MKYLLCFLIFIWDAATLGAIAANVLGWSSLSDTILISLIASAMGQTLLLFLLDALSRISLQND